MRRLYMRDKELVMEVLHQIGLKMGSGLDQ